MHKIYYYFVFERIRQILHTPYDGNQINKLIKIIIVQSRVVIAQSHVVIALSRVIVIALSRVIVIALAELG